MLSNLCYTRYITLNKGLTFGHIWYLNPSFPQESPVFDPSDKSDHLPTWTFLALYIPTEVQDSE